MNHAEDTLSRRTLCVLIRWRGCLHLLCVRKLCEQASFKILSALILLPTVDEHFVLKVNKHNSENLDMLKKADTQSCKLVPPLCWGLFRKQLRLTTATDKVVSTSLKWFRHLANIKSSVVKITAAKDGPSTYPLQILAA